MNSNNNLKEKMIEKLAGKKPANIVCVGNSITWGHILTSYITKKPTQDNYPFNLELLLRKYYKNNKIKVYNEGHDGWTVKDFFINKTGLKKVLKLKPDLIIIMFGIIEVITFPRLSLGLYIKYLEETVNVLKNKNINILILTPTPIYLFDKILSKYSIQTIKFSNKNELDCLDIRNEIFKYIQKNNLKKSDILKIDNVHFKEKKYKIISEIIFNKYFKNNYKKSK